MSTEDSIRYGVDLGERGMAALLDEAFGVFDCSGASPDAGPRDVPTPERGGALALA